MCRAGSAKASLAGPIPVSNSVLCATITTDLEEGKKAQWLFPHQQSLGVRLETDDVRTIQAQHLVIILSPCPQYV